MKSHWKNFIEMLCHKEICIPVSSQLATLEHLCWLKSESNRSSISPDQTAHPFLFELVHNWLNHMTHSTPTTAIGGVYSPLLDCRNSYEPAEPKKAKAHWYSQALHLWPQGMANHFPVMIIGTWLGCLLIEVTSPTIVSLFWLALQLVAAWSPSSKL